MIRKSSGATCAIFRPRAASPLHIVDILDRESLRQVFEEIRPDTIVHLAAWAGVRPSLEKPKLYSSVNVTGTVQPAGTGQGIFHRCFIFGSSSSVYGGNTKVPFSEDDPVDRPVSPYAATKQAGELLCHTYAHNFHAYHLPSLLHGVRPEAAPRNGNSQILPSSWLQGKEIPIFGAGDSRRDYTYVEDIVSGILGAIEVNPRFEIINLGESQTTTLLELVGQLEDALGQKALLRFLPNQPGDMEITYADISRARRFSDTIPRNPLRKASASSRNGLKAVVSRQSSVRCSQLLRTRAHVLH